MKYGEIYTYVQLFRFNGIYYIQMRLRKTNSTEKRLFNDYGIPFLQARIPYSPLNDCNTVIPASLKVNLNLGTYSVVKPYLQEMAAEIIKITNGK